MRTSAHPRIVNGVNRTLSVIIAVVASVAAQPLLWSGTVTVLTGLSATAYGGAPITAVLTLLGAGVLLGAAGFTIRLSWLGPVVAGALHAAGGLFMLVVPIDGIPAWTMLPYGITSQLGFSELSRGISLTASWGTGLLIGMPLLLAGLLHGRGRGATSAARAAAAIGGAVAALVALGAAYPSSVALSMQIARRFEPGYAVLETVLLVLACLAFGVVGFTMRWTTGAAWAVGGFLTLAGTVTLFSAFGVAHLLPMAAFLGFLNGPWPVLPAIGLGLLGLALGATLRTRAERDRPGALASFPNAGGLPYATASPASAPGAGAPSPAAPASPQLGSGNGWATDPAATGGPAAYPGAPASPVQPAQPTAPPAAGSAWGEPPTR